MKSVLLFLYMIANKSKLSVEEKVSEISNKVHTAIFKFMALLFLGLSSIFMFSLSFVMLLLKIGEKADEGYFYWTNSMTIFSSLIVLSVLPLFYLKGKAKIKQQVKQVEEESAPSIEDAVSMLIMDFVNARKEDRKSNRSQHDLDEED